MDAMHLGGEHEHNDSHARPSSESEPILERQGNLSGITVPISTPLLGQAVRCSLSQSSVPGHFPIDYQREWARFLAQTTEIIQEHTYFNDVREKDWRRASFERREFVTEELIRRIRKGTLLRPEFCTKFSIKALKELFQITFEEMFWCELPIYQSHDTDRSFLARNFGTGEDDDFEEFVKKPNGPQSCMIEWADLRGYLDTYREQNGLGKRPSREERRKMLTKEARESGKFPCGSNKCNTEQKKGVKRPRYPMPDQFPLTGFYEDGPWYFFCNSAQLILIGAVDIPPYRPGIVPEFEDQERSTRNAVAGGRQQKRKAQETAPIAEPQRKKLAKTVSVVVAATDNMTATVNATAKAVAVALPIERHPLPSSPVASPTRRTRATKEAISKVPVPAKKNLLPSPPITPATPPVPEKAVPTARDVLGKVSEKDETWSSVVQRAIRESPHRRLQLSHILDWIEENEREKMTGTRQALSKSIRSILSRAKKSKVLQLFDDDERLARPEDGTDKKPLTSSWWCLHDDIPADLQALKQA